MSVKLNIKITLILLFAFYHISGFCGWKEIATDQVATEFVNPETMQKSGIYVLMWSMSDYKVPQEVGNGRLFKSTKALQEFDCENRRKRFFNIIHYVESMGLGQVAYIDRNLGGWRDIKAGSLADMQFSVACK